MIICIFLEFSVLFFVIHLATPRPFLTTDNKATSSPNVNHWLCCKFVSQVIESLIMRLGPWTQLRAWSSLNPKHSGSECIALTHCDTFSSVNHHCHFSIARYSFIDHIWLFLRSKAPGNKHVYNQQQWLSELRRYTCITWLLVQTLLGAHPAKTKAAMTWYWSHVAICTKMHWNIGGLTLKDWQRQLVICRYSSFKIAARNFDTYVYLAAFYDV